MKRLVYCSVILLILLVGNRPGFAAKIKAFVTGFSLSGVENKEEMKPALQTLLMTRLNGEEIQSVENQNDAEVLVSASYLVYGTVFSLDATAKTSSGVLIDRVFVQGDTQNEMIPALGELARRLSGSILYWHDPQAAKPVYNKAVSSIAGKKTAKTAKAVPPAPKPEKKAKTPAPLKPSQEENVQKAPEQPWVSQRLPEILNGIASGRMIEGEGMEIFVTGENFLRYYYKEKELRFLCEILFESDEKVLGVDVADLDRNGVPEVYVSLLKKGLPASQVFIPDSRELKLVAGKLPYLLRSVSLEGKEKKILAQKMDTYGKLTGDVYELAKKGNDFIARNPLQLPIFGNLYSFNMFSDAKGKGYFIVYHPDGYLLVYSKTKKLLWKSSDKYGGYESGVNRIDELPELSGGYPAPRIHVTRKGDVVVSRNSGLFTIGDTRSYSKNYVMKLSWDGSSLQEKWRFEQSRNYLADFSYDERLRELLLLEVDQKDAAGTNRGTKIVMKPME